MKTLLFIISWCVALLGISTFARAENAPYQMMNDLYGSAKPMPITVLPTPQSTDLSQWSCIGAKKDTTQEDIMDQIKDGPFAPMLVQGKKNDRAVWFIKNDGSDLPTPAQVSEQNASLQSTFDTKNGLVVTMQFTDGGAKVVAKYRYLQMENQTVIVVNYEGAEAIPFLNDFTLCSN